MERCGKIAGQGQIRQLFREHNSDKTKLDAHTDAVWLDRMKLAGVFYTPLF
jgi:hypothetical protein